MTWQGSDDTECWQRVVALDQQALAHRSEMETRAGQRDAKARILQRWAEAEARRPRKIRPIPERRLA
jgi:hypothetical protein